MRIMDSESVSLLLYAEADPNRAAREEDRPIFIACSEKRPVSTDAGSQSRPVCERFLQYARKLQVCTRGLSWVGYTQLEVADGENTRER